MPYLLSDDVVFPPPSYADDDGFLAVGGDLRPERLLTAYAMGIFPWYSEDTPILWWSPDPRFVLWPSNLHVGRSLRQKIRSGTFEVRFDTAFREVVEACAEVRRGPKQEQGTWITQEMCDAYCTLHELGFAHSVESWKDGELVGGLYGVALGSCFFGESMFFRVSDASKVAFATLARHLVQRDYTMIDCQMPTEHLRRFGACDVPREEFLQHLEGGLQTDTERGQWALDPDFKPFG